MGAAVVNRCSCSHEHWEHMVHACDYYLSQSLHRQLTEDEKCSWNDGTCGMVADICNTCTCDGCDCPLRHEWEGEVK